MAERGSLERLVMDQLWRAERPLLIREILERVNAARNEAPLAYTTMQTVCDRLTAKGALERIPAGRANLYRPTHSRDEHIAHLMIEALADSSDRSSVFTWFVELVDGNDARKLRAALESRRGRRRPTR